MYLLASLFLINNDIVQLRYNINSNIFCKQSVQLLKTDRMKLWHRMDSRRRQSLLLFFVVFLASSPSGVDSQCEVLSRGGYIERTLHITETVCDVMHTAIIAKDHTLHLRPGVKLRFAPGVMLAINGTLIAQVDKANDFCMLLVFQRVTVCQVFKCY